MFYLHILYCYSCRALKCIKQLLNYVSYAFNLNKVTAGMTGMYLWSYLMTLQSLQVTWSWNISRHSAHSMSWRGTCGVKQRQRQPWECDANVKKNVAAKHMQSVHEVWQTDADPFSKLVVVDRKKTAFMPRMSCNIACSDEIFNCINQTTIQPHGAKNTQVTQITRPGEFPLIFHITSHLPELS